MLDQIYANPNSAPLVETDEEAIALAKELDHPSITNIRAIKTYTDRLDLVYALLCWSVLIKHEPSKSKNRDFQEAFTDHARENKNAYWPSDATTKVWSRYKHLRLVSGIFS